MAPLDQFETRMRELIDGGCTIDDAFTIAKQEFTNLARQADKLLRIKQKIEREQRFDW